MSQKPQESPGSDPVADSTPQPGIDSPGESSNALSTQAHRCARPYCPNQARKGKRWGKYCSDKCRMEVWAYRNRRKSIACGPRRRNLDRRFKEWLDTTDGQTVYVEVLRRALQLLDSGWKHYSIDALVQSVRFDRAIQVGPDADGFKINDCHRSRLARLLMEREPRLADPPFFETRQLREAR